MTPGKTFAMIAGATCLGLCLFCGGCFGITALVRGHSASVRERSLARGAAQKLRPLASSDREGTVVYEWNADLPSRAPKSIGRYQGNQVAHGDEISAAAVDRNGKATYFDIEDDQFRYWVDQD